MLEQNRKKDVGISYDYNDALEKVRVFITEEIAKQIDDEEQEKEKKDVVKDKEYLRRYKAKYREIIKNIVYRENIKVKGYEKETDAHTIEDFIEDMVGEFAGYSVLEEAFADDEVSDIFCLAWNKIYVEKAGKNVKYQHIFRDKKHYKDFINNLLKIDGKEINNGDSKIVDFEVYGDRGCATSPAVSPLDYSLTIRKHAEDHITEPQLVHWKVLSPKMSKFLGMAIMGECNIIYAGITGSGKTTTIRALLDKYVTLSNKRMMVCEDTQELFPKNDHTLELVSVKADNPKNAVSLQQLIYTALRLKPKYIVVGEVRAEEAQSAVEGMETGHSTIFTMHGRTPINICNRLVTKYITAMPSLGIQVVERIIGSAVDFVCIQDNIPGIGRRLTSITEIGYDFEKNTVTTNLIWRFNYKTGQFNRVGYISKDKAEKMLSRGIPLEEIDPWVKGGLYGEDGETDDGLKEMKEYTEDDLAFENYV